MVFAAEGGRRELTLLMQGTAPPNEGPLNSIMVGRSSSAEVGLAVHILVDAPKSFRIGQEEEEEEEALGRL